MHNTGACMLLRYAKTTMHQRALCTPTHARAAPPHALPLSHLQTAFANGKRFMRFEIFRIQLSRLRRVYERTADELLSLGLPCVRVRARHHHRACVHLIVHAVANRHAPAGARARGYGECEI